MTEEWKSIPGFDNYQASNLGKIRSIKSRFGRAGKILSPKDNGKGYKMVCLSSNRQRQYVYIHRLVLLAFLGPKDLHCNHIDGDKSNNALSNLEYVTRSENMKHAVDNGLVPHGEDDPKAIMSNQDIRDIRLIVQSLHGALATRYGVSISTIKEILAYRKRKNG